MLLNRVEKWLMNNAVRSLVQRRFEAQQLLAMGGTVAGGRALEIGCGRGVGVEIIFDLFRAARVDAFDLDPDMVARARARLLPRRDAVRLWVGDATAIDAPNGLYDAVFDFGIVHHVPRWRDALAEAWRVLRPGGRLYAEEVFARALDHAALRALLRHPGEDRFDHDAFRDELVRLGFELVESRDFWGHFGMFVADKPMVE